MHGTGFPAGWLACLVSQQAMQGTVLVAGAREVRAQDFEACAQKHEGCNNTGAQVPCLLGA